MEEQNEEEEKRTDQSLASVERSKAETRKVGANETFPSKPRREKRKKDRGRNDEQKKKGRKEGMKTKKKKAK
jgi:hypothetical protein